MHTDLSSHLHSAECNELIQALHNCHQQHAFRKFVGYCNDANEAMLKCLKKERQERRKVNFDKSQARQQKFRQEQQELLEQQLPKATPTSSV